jgi:uncharacterized protein YaaR (DUF327 family)
MYTELLKLIGKGKVVVLNPNVQQTHVYKIETKKYTFDKIEEIKKNIKSNFRSITTNQLIQTETFYKDLIKVSIKSQINKEYFIKKDHNFHKILNGNLVTVTSIHQIDKNQCPVLNEYNYVLTKNIDVYKIASFEMKFTSLGEENIIQFDVSGITSNDLPLLDTIIKNFI